MEKVKNLLVEMHYLPCTEYFIHLIKAENVEFEIKEFYEKQSYRNRTKILSCNKVEVLTVPIINEGKREFKEVKIDYSQKWLNVHKRAIQSAYGKAACFEYFSDEFFRVYDKKNKFLMDLNLELLTICLKIAGRKPEMRFSEEYRQVVGNEYIDLRNQVHPKNSSEKSALIEKVRYSQVFGREFVSNLSIIDLLFNEGTNSINILKKGA